ncbi:uncharacterized protein DS421_14g488750 [Arachis hypogaea]|nr:uncharacterized protein DS421_14g488750 [Arachis hypogaea]
MAKFFAAFILALIAISMLQTMVMAANGQGGHFYDNKSQYGPGSVKSYRGVARPNTTSPACSFVRSVVGSAFVFLRGIMVTKLFALATTTGRPRKEDQNALKLHQPLAF